MRLLRRHKFRFPIGKRVKLKNSSRRGAVIKILDNPDAVRWDAGKPFFIEVQFDDGDVVKLHPGVLKTKNR